MTLYASIEKMKEHLESVAICINNESVHDAIDKALAAAPAQALGEEDVYQIAIDAFKKNQNIFDALNALRDKGVLYVREGE